MKRKILLLLLFVFSITSVKAAPDNNVAEINGTYYTSLSKAINAASSDNKTTITLLKDISENVIIKEGYDIVLDLNNHTLSNKTDATVITNNGTLEVKNGTLTSDAGSGMINNNSKGKLTVSSGILKATGTRQAIYNDGGTLYILDGAYVESSAEERATIQNKNDGKAYIKGGTIVSNNLYAIYNEKGTLNIGVKDDVYDKTTPVVQGKTYGVVANNTYNVYDGIIKGGIYHVGKTSNTGNTPTVSNDTNETKVTGIEEDSEKLLDSENISGTTYKTFTFNLDNSNRITITFDANGGNVNPTYKKITIGDEIKVLPIPTKVDNSFDGWFTNLTGGTIITENTKPTENITYYAHWTYVDPSTVAYVEGVGYRTLKEAFALGGKIRLEKDVIITESLSMNKNAELDLNGHTISLENNSITINNNVTITDLSSNKKGKITSKDDFTIIVSSTGNLTHKGGTIEGLGTYGAINNKGTLEVDGGTITNTSNMYAIYNNNKLIMQSGTVYSTNGSDIQVGPNSTFEMNGGLLKTDGINEQAVNLDANSTTTINGGTIEALNTNGAGIGSFGGSTLTVNGGTIKGYDMAIAGNGNDNNGNVTITINDGTLIATHGVGMYLPQQHSTTIINGGNISGPTAIEIRAANLTVNDGTITGTSDIYEIKANNSGTTSKGAAIAVSQHTTKQPIEVTINGGNLKSLVPIAEANSMSNPPEAIELIKIIINQGDFESTGEKDIYAENPSTIIQLVTGGTYTYDSSQYVKDGYGVVKIADSKYEVTKIHNIKIDSNSINDVSIDKTEYPYKSNVELKIKEKMGYESIIEVKGASGNLIKVNGNKFIMPDEDVIVNINYKKLINPNTGDNIMIYFTMLGVSIIGLGLFIMKKQN